MMITIHNFIYDCLALLIITIKIYLLGERDDYTIRIAIAIT